jgi:serine-type D-Ala-D-Ala carboxypeptidase/endopeptidase
MARYLVEDGEAPGVVLGVVAPDGSSRAVAYGHADPRSLFDLGSLTMTFTATLLAEMATRGEVGLEDPVRQYLLEHVAVPAPGGYEMTLGDLATHRSGLPAGPHPPYREVSVDALYEMVSTAELVRPGRRYELSHLGYALLGHALARSAGTDFESLLRERVLEPLGMARSGYAPGTPGAAGSAGSSGPGSVATGHSRGRAVPIRPAPPAMRPATGLWSSGEDMLRFLQANVGPPGTDLERAMRMAHEIRVERGRPDEELGYGLSWRTQSVAGQSPILTHGGRAAGFVSMMAFDQEKAVGTVVLASDDTFNDWIGRSLLFFDPSPWEPVRVEPERLRRWEGTYRSNVGMYRASLRQGRHHIRLEKEGHLTYQPNGRARVALYARSDSVFYMLRLPVTLTFRTDGDVVAMTFEVDEREEGSRGWTAWKVTDRTPPAEVVAGNAPAWRGWRLRTWLLLGLTGAAAAAVGGLARSAARRRTPVAT